MGIISQIFSKKNSRISEGTEPLTKEQYYQDIINRFRQILNSLTNPVIAIELDGSIFYMSQGAAKLLNTQIQAMIGRKFFQILPLNPKEDLHKFYGKFLDQHYRDFTELQFKEKTIKLTINPIFDENSKGLIGAVIEFSDLTDQKKTEQKQVDFISYISHELRTPITSVKGYLDVLLDEANYLTDEHKVFVQRAYISNERQHETVEKLINLSDLEQGQLKVEFTEVDIMSIINQVVNNWQSIVKEKNLFLTIKYPKFVIPKIKTDQNLFTNILNNLIDNAVKYTITGGVTIATDPRVEKVIITITDTGPGMSEATKNDLFEKFVRGERPLTESTQGSGLGLYLTKRFIEQIGGELTVDSEINVGTIFTITLPVSVEPKNS